MSKVFGSESPIRGGHDMEQGITDHDSATGKTKSQGFTLLEILVVVFILSLLAAIVAPRIIGRTDDARIAEAKVQIRNFETALKLFKMDNGF